MTSKSKQAPSVPDEVSFRHQAERPADVEVVRFEELYRRSLSHDVSRPHRLHFHALLLIESGSSYHDVDFQRYSVTPGDLLVVPAKHVHAFAHERALSGSLVIFTPSLLEECDLSVRKAGHILLHAGPCLHLGDEGFPRAKRACQILADSIEHPTLDFAEPTIKAAFSLLVLTLAGLPEAMATIEDYGPQDALAARFRALLEDHFTITHQASFYAKTLHVSLRTLDRHLVQARGQSTRQAISARLVLEAKRLLTDRERPIKDIAYSLGFSQSQNFARFFRSQTGSTPKAFRKIQNG